MHRSICSCILSKYTCNSFGSFIIDLRCPWAELAKLVVMYSSYISVMWNGVLQISLLFYFRYTFVFKHPLLHVTKLRTIVLQKLIAILLSIIEPES